MDRFIAHEQRKLHTSTPVLADTDCRKSLFAIKLDTCNTFNERFYNKEVIIGENKLKEMDFFVCSQAQKMNKTQ